jgi:hypothetical protein
MGSQVAVTRHAREEANDQQDLLDRLSAQITCSKLERTWEHLK